MVELAGAWRSGQCSVKESGERNWEGLGTERRQNQTHPGEVKMTVKVIAIKLGNRYIGIASPLRLFEETHSFYCIKKELRTIKETHLTVERKGKEENCAGSEPGTQQGILEKV